MSTIYDQDATRMITVASYTFFCPTCAAGPYEPCTFTTGWRLLEPRLNYDKTHKPRWVKGIPAYEAWQKWSWPNTEVA
jgi:hypothetical protein